MKSQAIRHLRELHAVIRAEFLPDHRLMVGHGLLAKAESFRDARQCIALHEQAQHLEFTRRQLPSRRPFLESLAQRERLRDVGTQITRASGDGAHTFHKDVGRACFRHVAARAGVERAPHEDGLLMHAEDQHVGVGLAREHAPHGFNAACARQREIHDHHVRFQRAKALVGLRRVGGLTRHADVRTELQQTPVTFAHDRVVIDEKNTDIRDSHLRAPARSATS